MSRIAQDNASSQDQNRLQIDPGKPFSVAQSAAGLVSATARRLAIQATRQVMADGSVICQDSPPGVGWILDIYDGVTSKGNLRFKPRRYYATRDRAITAWKELTQCSH